MSHNNLRESGKAKGNVYERIIAAAHEARRLNAQRLRGGTIDTEAKITNEALRRTAEGEVEWEVAPGRAGDDADGPAEEWAAEESPLDDSR